MFYIIQEEIEGIWGASILSDPKKIAWLPDGTVQIREHIPENVGRRFLFSGQTDRYAAWVAHGGEWRELEKGVLSAPGHEDDAYLMDTLWGEDLALEAEVRSEGGGIGSLVVRGNPSAFAGYRISLDFARGKVGLYRRFPAIPDENIQVIQNQPVIAATHSGYPSGVDKQIQERDANLEPGRWHKLKVVVQGKFIDIYLDDGLSIVHDIHPYRDGSFGLHARGPNQFPPGASL